MTIICTEDVVQVQQNDDSYQIMIANTVLIKVKHWWNKHEQKVQSANGLNNECGNRKPYQMYICIERINLLSFSPTYLRPVKATAVNFGLPQVIDIDEFYRSSKITF